MNLFRSNLTLKPLKSHKAGKRSELAAYSKKTLATLGTGSMKQAVQLPQGENINEWLAVNTVDFFNELSMLYGTISELCSDASCPVMSAGDKQYLWCDGVKIKKPMTVSAPAYVDYLMTWVESQLNDEEIFPIKFDAPFPKKFPAICATIYKRFFRIYAHIYYHHIKQIEEMQAATHLNTCFKHFIYFVDEFQLVSKDEQAPLRELIDNIYRKDAAGGAGSTGSHTISASGGRGAGGAGNGGGNTASHEDTLTKEQDVLAK